ncbi:Fur-regulated basic protein FbpA [Fictibacillus iocasae]|uniref:Fur-regulated basic protein FbpA n=1 Tax=Fictibacillus iocasae TaxID=2715437 RepID=A0ABW2NVK6_9BACL
MEFEKGALRKAVEGRKAFLIQQLLHKGMMGMEDHRHLQDWTLSELENEWRKNNSVDEDLLG